MTESFEARNELEQKLMAAQEGSLPESEFMDYLLDAQVFMLVLFTSPERAKDFVQDYPGYEGGLLVEFKWVLERTGSGVGISLNPTWPVGMDLEAETVQQLKLN
jgi:hypothetical protein